MSLIRPFGLLGLICLLSWTQARSQQLLFVQQAGGPGNDESHALWVDGNGDVVMAGKFSGTVDFDPSPATLNLTSAGATDAFVAKYTGAGALIWAFRFGGSNLDEINDVVTDAQNNIVVTGFIRGLGVDINPGPATFELNSNGDSGGDPGYGGDIVIIKYSPLGQLIWGFNVGGTSIGDNGIAIRTDAAGDVYLGGYFNDQVDFDPGAGTNNLQGADGTAFLAKYTSAGTFAWAFNFGLGNSNNSMFDIMLDGAGGFYATGYFQGTNIDFDPGPATAYLSSQGGYETFIAKYTTNGDYVNAFSIGTGGTDVGRGIIADAANNIYVIGDFSGADTDFDPGPGTALLSSVGSGDVFIAKYSATGTYQWAFRFGGPSNDFGWKIDTDGSHLFVTGGFNGTTDLNPSDLQTENISSNGGYDIFIGKYNFNGEYLCGFSVGGVDDDQGYSIRVSAPNTIFLTGGFRASNVDFDPSGTTSNLNSAGESDAFLAKYFWPDVSSTPTGTLDGSSVCGDTPATLTFNQLTGSGPFSVRYTDGTTEYLAENVQSGIPFEILAQPTSNTTYTLVAVRDNQRCSESNYFLGNSVLVEVDRRRVVAGNDTLVCNQALMQFSASNAQSYSWLPSTGLSDPNIANPTVVVTQPQTYIVTGTSVGGCLTRDTVQVNMANNPVIEAMQDTLICNQARLQLGVTAGFSYRWFPAVGLDNPNIENPVFTPGATTEFFVTATDLNGCTATDSVTVTIRPEAVITATADFTGCVNSRVQLNASGAGSFSWSPSTGLDNSAIMNPTATITSPVRYIVTGSNPDGCTGKDTVNIMVYPETTTSVTPDTSICAGSYLQLLASGGTSYSWATSPTLSNPDVADPFVGPVQNTRYVVTITDQYNCDYRDSVLITLRPAGIFKVNDPLSTCFNTPVQLLASGGDTYSWEPGPGISNPQIANPTANPATSTTYLVTISESVCGQSETLSTTVTVKPTPLVSVEKANDLDCSTASSQLLARGAQNYSWSPSASLSNAGVQNPVASPVVSTTYVVSGTTNGCSDTASVLVEVTKDNPGGYLMPNAFTPNNDGVNDCFGIGYWGAITELRFSIYNRWGERIFYSESPTACWDGTYKGTKQNGDVYVYVITAKTLCNPAVFRKGTFVLIR